MVAVESTLIISAEHVDSWRLLLALYPKQHIIELVVKHDIILQVTVARTPSWSAWLIYYVHYLDALGQEVCSTMVKQS